MKLSAFINFLFAVFLLSCEGEINPSFNKIGKIKELNYHVYSNIKSHFSYAPDGKLNKRITTQWFTDEAVFWADTITYEYNGSNNVSLIRFSETFYMTFLYDSKGNMIESNHNYIYENKIPIKHTTKYYYVDGNKLHTAQSGDGSTIFQFDANGNLSTKTLYVNGIQWRKTTYFIYDNKPNPLKGNPFIFDNSGFDLERIDYFSNNNPLEYEIWHKSGGVYRSKNSYSYNSDGFWTEGPHWSITYTP